MFSSYRSSIRTIDPTNMTKEDSQILYDFLKIAVSNGVYFITKSRTFPISSKVRSRELSFFMLTHNISWRQCYSDPTDCRWDVQTEFKLGQGGYGKIYQVIGVLEPLDNQTLCYKGHKRRVIKEKQFNKKQNNISDPDADNEYNLTSRVRELHVKPPTFFSVNSDPDQIVSMMVMRYISGKNLQAIVENDQGNKKINKNLISTDQRIKLSIGVLRALERQVHGNNIVHRDIKPENIIVDLSANTLQVTIIDYGLSTDSRCDDGKHACTPVYAPPECYDRKRMDEKSDIFSMAWVIARIWRANDNPAKNLKEAANFSHHCHFDDLFSGVTDLNQKHKDAIDSLLKKMVECNPAERCTLEHAISVFEQILLERKLIKVEESLRQDIEKAFCAGIQLRKKLDSVSKQYNVIFHPDFEKFKTIFASEFNCLADSPEVISVFIDRLDINVLRGLTTKQEISEKINDLIKFYCSNFQLLVNLRDRTNMLLQLASKELTEKNINTNQIEFALQKILRKIQLEIEKFKYPLTLDNLALANEKFQKYVTRLTPLVEKYHEEISALSYLDLSANVCESSRISSSSPAIPAKNAGTAFLFI